MTDSGETRHDELPWWKRTTVYQIYPRSFSDLSGDGIGDLPGIIARLDYLHWLGVETIWLSPFFDSPQADFGYDITNHFEVSPEYGSLGDCRRLIDEIHARDMKVVLDMVLNHTSDQHPWFRESRRSRDNPYRDFYIWRDGRKPNGAAPPNNWSSMLGGSGWQYDAQTGQWYWASFLPFQPDLNYRNPKAKHAMLDVVRHWLREGVDGLRLDIFNAIYKDASFADNPRSLRAIPTEDNPGGFFQRAVHTQNHPDTFDFARELRAVVDKFNNPPRFVVGEVFGSTDVLRKYCGPSADGLNLVFLFKSLRTAFRAHSFRQLVEEFESRCLPQRSAAAEHEEDLLSPALAHCCEMFDGAGTLHGIEPRHPFLDRELAEFCLAVPPELKLRDGYPRWLQRAAMRGLLPEEVRLRPNKNRTSPGYARRLLRCGNRGLFDVVMEHRDLVGEYVDLDRVRAARERFAAQGELADAKRVWYAGQLALWLARAASEGVHA